jgi:uncharacterized membrane protein
MLWVLLSLLAAFMWAAGNVIDKYVLTKWLRNPSVPILFSGTIGLAAAIVVFILNGFYQLSLINTVLALFAGGLVTAMNLLYFRAVKREEISRVVPLFYIAPLFVLVLAAAFLGEVFTYAKYAGILLLVAGAFIISSKSLLRPRFGRAFWFMVLASLTAAINLVIGKYLLGFADFWTVFSYLRIGEFAAAVPVFYFTFGHLSSAMKSHGKRVAGVISLNTFLNLAAKLTMIIAVSVGYVTLVDALSSMQAFFVLTIAVALSIFYPKIMKEDIGRRTVLLKLAATALMFFGVFLII